MILNLLRVEELRVEDMLKRSFAEFHMQKDAQERKRQMEEVEEKLQHINDVDCTFCSGDLKSYFKACQELSPLTNSVKVMIRMLATPGRLCDDQLLGFHLHKLARRVQ